MGFLDCRFSPLVRRIADFAMCFFLNLSTFKCRFIWIQLTSILLMIQNSTRKFNSEWKGRILPVLPFFRGELLNFGGGYSCISSWLFGGFKDSFIFTLTWGNDPFWRAYFSVGLKPPTSWRMWKMHVLFKIGSHKTSEKIRKPFGLLGVYD